MKCIVHNARGTQELQVRRVNKGKLLSPIYFACFIAYGWLVWNSALRVCMRTIFICMRMSPLGLPSM